MNEREGILQKTMGVDLFVDCVTVRDGFNTSLYILSLIILQNKDLVVVL